MCVTQTARILSVNGRKAIADVNGEKVELNTELVDVKPGDTVICSLDTALEKVEDEDL